MINDHTRLISVDKVSEIHIVFVLVAQEVRDRFALFLRVRQPHLIVGLHCHFARHLDLLPSTQLPRLDQGVHRSDVPMG